MSARKARAISQPNAIATQVGEGHFSKPLAGSMFSSGSLAPAEPLGREAVSLQVPTRFEPGSDLSDDAWERRVAMAEAQAGIPPAPEARTPNRADPSSIYYEAAAGLLPPAPRGRVPPVDLSALPKSFALQIEQKNGQWKVTAPDVHVGLWIANPDLPTALTEAVGALAEIVRVDGMTPRTKRGRKTK